MNSWASESFEIVPIEGVSGTYAFESVRLSIYQHYSINETAIEAFVSNFVENKLTTVESVVRA